MSLLRSFFSAGTALLADAIDRWATGISRDELVERCANLAAENHDLRDDLAYAEDRCRFNGPTLYADEVEVISRLITVGDSGAVLQGLLDRYDPFPFTAAQLERDVLAATAITMLPDGSLEESDRVKGFMQEKQVYSHTGRPKCQCLECTTKLGEGR